MEGTEHCLWGESGCRVRQNSLLLKRDMRRLKDPEKEWVEAGKGRSLARVGSSSSGSDFIARS